MPEIKRKRGRGQLGVGRAVCPAHPAGRRLKHGPEQSDMEALSAEVKALILRAAYDGLSNSSSIAQKILDAELLLIGDLKALARDFKTPMDGGGRKFFTKSDEELAELMKIECEVAQRTTRVDFLTGCLAGCEEDCAGEHYT